MCQLEYLAHNYSFKNKKSTMLVVDFVAGVEGFEPSQAVLETDVLPLTLYPYELTLYYLSIKEKKKQEKIYFSCLYD